MYFTFQGNPLWHIHSPPEGDRELVPERERERTKARKRDIEDSGYLADDVVSCCSFQLRGGFAFSFFALGRFAGFVNRDLYQYALDVAARGVHPMGDRLPQRLKQEPYSAINDNVEATDAALWGVF